MKTKQGSVTPWKLRVTPWLNFFNEDKYQQYFSEKNVYNKVYIFNNSFKCKDDMNIIIRNVIFVIQMGQ